MHEYNNIDPPILNERGKMIRKILEKDEFLNNILEFHKLIRKIGDNSKILASEFEKLNSIGDSIYKEIHKLIDK